ENGYGPCKGRNRYDITIPECEECLTAVIKQHTEIYILTADPKVLARPILHKGKTENQRNGPDHQQKNQRQRSKVTQISFSPIGKLDPSRDVCPGSPSNAIKKGGQTEGTLNAPRQYDGLKGIQQNAEDDYYPGYRKEVWHVEIGVIEVTDVSRCRPDGLA